MNVLIISLYKLSRQRNWIPKILIKFLSLCSIDCNFDISGIGFACYHLKNISKNMKKYEKNKPLCFLFETSSSVMNLSSLGFFLYSVSCRVYITLFLFPVYFSIDKDNRIIFWNNRISFLNSFWKLPEYFRIKILEKNHDSLVVSLASFQLDDEKAWVKSERPISVDRRTRKSINTAADSEISSERKWKNDFLFFRIFISESDFPVLFYYWNSFDISRYTNFTRE